MLATTLVYVVIVALFGPLDKGLVVSTYVGLVLLGSLYTAVGVFFSACTRNQIIAVLSSFVLLAILTFLANWLAGQQEGLVRVVLQHLSIMSHYQDFARGLIDTNHVIYFLSSTGLFLFFAVKVLEFRRWR
jgi:ABC-2 type transport system permease protein